MEDKIKELEVKLAQIADQLDSLSASAEPLTAEQSAEYDRLSGEFDLASDQKQRAEDTLKRRKRLEQATPIAAVVQPTASVATIQTRPYIPAEAKDPSEARTFGFATFGHFCQEIIKAGITKTPTHRLVNAYSRFNAAATGMGVGVGADGGFMVPPEFSTKIFARLYAPDSIFARTEIYTIQGNSIKFPRINETSRAAGSRAGGVRAYWSDEGESVTASKPGLGQLGLSLHKLMAFGRATQELLDDSPMAIDAFYTKHFGDEINFVVGDSLFNGTGAGMPLGAFNADCVVQVAKETGQSGSTVNATNVMKMWSRLYAGCRQNAVWFINQDVEPQLYSMQIGTGVANQVVYMPPGGLSQAPYATLMGRPVMPVEYCSTLGTVGDIALIDFSQWVSAVKAGGPTSAVSMHLYFATDENAFRTTYRLDSQPWWNSPLTPFKGSNTQSCAITLATRA